MFSYKLAKGTPLLEASWWKKRHGRSRSGLCKWSIKRAWNANKWTMAKCNIYTSFFSMLHTSFEVVVSLKVIFYPNGFLEKKNYAKTRTVGFFGQTFLKTSRSLQPNFFCTVEPCMCNKCPSKQKYPALWAPGAPKGPKGPKNRFLRNLRVFFNVIIFYFGYLW